MKMQFEVDKFNQYNLIENAKHSTCPLCSEYRKKKDDKCCNLDWERGLGHCHHCGETFQLHTYKSKNENKKPYKKPENWNNTNLSDKLVKWFENRKISQFILRKMKISESVEYMPQIKKNINTLQFNYFKNNTLTNIKYRDGNKNFKLFKDAELIFYNYDFCTTSKDVVIVEGEMDCLSYIESGVYHCLSTPNGSTLKNVNLEYLDNCIELFDNKEKIYLALDNDEAGKNVTKELIRRLGAYRCFLVDFGTCKDANEYLIKFGKDELKKTLDTAKAVPLYNVKIYNDIQNEYHSFLANGLAGGVKCGIKPIDEVYSILEGFFEVITGIPTHGKSEILDSIVLGRILQNNFKVAYVSVENNPTFLHVAKLVPKLLGYKPNNFDVQKSDFKEVENFINENIFFVDFSKTYDLRTVLDKIMELVVRKGVKMFVLDPFNKIRMTDKILTVTGNTINDYTAQYLNMIDEFTRQNNLIGSLVAHPTKLLKEGTKRPMPDFYDVKGGAEFFDMSNFGLSVYREFDVEKTIIKVLKCKFQHLGINNAEIELKYNKKNGRFNSFTLDSSFEAEDNKLWISKVKPEYDYNNFNLNEPIPF